MLIYGWVFFGLYDNLATGFEEYHFWYKLLFEQGNHVTLWTRNIILSKAIFVPTFVPSRKHTRIDFDH